jgi:uncharacterized membrane protein
LGGIGSILMLVGGLGSLGIHYLGDVLPIVGLIMTLIAVKYIADVVQDQAIFKNVIIGVILAIAGVVVLGVLVLGSIGNVITNFGGLRNGGTTSFSFATTTNANGQVVPVIPQSFMGAILTILAGFAILWILLIISSIFVRRGYNLAALKLNVKLFRTSALLYLIGAILTIAFGIGLIIVLIAQILLIIAFFSIPDALPATYTPGTYGTPPPPSQTGAFPNPPASPTTATRTCPRCGAPVSQDAVFCPSCGSSLTQ